MFLPLLLLLEGGGGTTVTPPPPAVDPLTPAEIADGLAGRFGSVPMRLRYERRSLSYQFRDDITGAVIDKSVPTLTLDNDRAVLRDVRGIEFMLDRLPGDFDPTSDNVAIIEERLIRPPDRTEGAWVSFPQGLFRVDLGMESYEPGLPPTVMADAADLGDPLTSSGPTSTYTVNAGTSYRQACESVLSQLGLSHGLTPSLANLPRTVSWPAYPETSWWDILRDLSDGINYRTPWPDVRGKFVWAPKDIRPDLAVESVTYTDDVEPLMIVGTTPYERERNAGTLPNVAVVVVDVPGHPAFGFVSRRNADLSSPLSTVNRQERRVVFNSDSKPSTRAILDTATAIALAETTLQHAASSYRTAKLSTFPDPRREAHEYLRLAIGGVEEGTLWQVAKWSRALTTGGVQQFDLRRAQSATLTEG